MPIKMPDSSAPQLLSLKMSRTLAHLIKNLPEISQWEILNYVLVYQKTQFKFK